MVLLTCPLSSSYSFFFFYIHFLLVYVHQYFFTTFSSLLEAKSFTILLRFFFSFSSRTMVSIFLLFFFNLRWRHRLFTQANLLGKLSRNFQDAYVIIIFISFDIKKFSQPLNKFQLILSTVGGEHIAGKVSTVVRL